MATPEATAASAAGRRVEVTLKKATGPGDDKIHTWPHLVRAEFLCSIAVVLFLTIWALLVDAPLESPANPARTPNPSKAPWYFLGLQEILVYFDPWWAGVGLPGTIMMGLIAIPYVDRNPKGNGYFTLRERKGAITVFCFGFFILWLLLAFIGTFLRGPGWNFFGLFKDWDAKPLILYEQ